MMKHACDYKRSIIRAKIIGRFVAGLVRRVLLMHFPRFTSADTLADCKW